MRCGCVCAEHMGAAGRPPPERSARIGCSVANPSGLAVGLIGVVSTATDAIYKEE